MARNYSFNFRVDCSSHCFESFLHLITMLTLKDLNQINHTIFISAQLQAGRQSKSLKPHFNRSIFTHIGWQKTMQRVMVSIFFTFRTLHLIVIATPDMSEQKRKK
jgi:hypothetical protein